MDSNSEIEQECPNTEQILQQANRIAASSGFAGSESLRNVFLYLTRHAIEHPGTTVKEYEIATQALGRDHNFDSRIDSVVRASASRLRSKLAEYYLHQGENDPVLIELSKGSYSLIFSLRNKAIPAPPRKNVDDTLAPKALPSLSRKTSSLPWVLCCILGCVVAGSLGYLAGRRVRHTPVPASIQQFWGDFLKGGDPLIIFPNPTFRGLPETGMQLVEPDAPGAVGTIDLFTGTGETMALETLSRQILLLGHDSRAKRAHLFTWDDAANTNLIFLGGQVQNGAFAQLPQLQRFSLKSPADVPFVGQGAVHDDKPAAGGESYYFASKDFSNGNDYAIIALTEGISSDHKILILAGSNTYGTEGAAEFLCTPDLVKALLDRLGVQAGAAVPSFEALLRVPVRGGAPISPQLIIAYRRQPSSGSEPGSHH
ncbi:MAG TPA: hypothetical protein VFE38_06690 [Edaphobacter sp.]|nr:hypothetical protein [Edaphobacter sp.]